MNNQPPKRRKSPRKYDYDYTQAGAYFVTICTFQRIKFFGEVVDGNMRLNFYGQAASHCWKAIPKHFEHVTVDEYIIMPNHMHGILFIEDGNTYPLGNIVGNYKGAVTRIINRYRTDEEQDSVWQRNFHEHIIRDEQMLNNLQAYIMNNPATWTEDRFYM